MHPNIMLRVSTGYQVPEQTCSCVLRARPKTVFYYGGGRVQWEPTVTTCLSAFKTERSFSGITSCLLASACTHMLKVVRAFKHFCRHFTIEDQKHHPNISYSPYSYNLGSGAATVVINGTFSDGKWHRVKAVRSDTSHTASNHYSACLSL